MQWEIAERAIWPGPSCDLYDEGHQNFDRLFGRSRSGLDPFRARMVALMTRPTACDISTQTVLLLGGAKALGMMPRNSLDWVHLVRRGFPVLTLDALGRNIEATNAELAQMMGISVRALAGRRRRKVLSHYESERLFRVARVIARTEEVFDDLANGFAWLNCPNISLGHVTPMSLLDTQIGTELITDVLSRIEHGIFA